jgi:hypothetical protein
MSTQKHVISIIKYAILCAVIVKMVPFLWHAGFIYMILHRDLSNVVNLFHIFALLLIDFNTLGLFISICCCIGVILNELKEVFVGEC